MYLPVFRLSSPPIRSLKGLVSDSLLGLKCTPFSCKMLSPRSNQDSIMTIDGSDSLIRDSWWQISLNTGMLRLYTQDGRSTMHYSFTCIRQIPVCRSFTVSVLSLGQSRSLFGGVNRGHEMCLNHFFLCCLAHWCYSWYFSGTRYVNDIRSRTRLIKSKHRFTTVDR